MKIIRKRPKKSSLDEHIEHNRISGIESIKEESGSQRNIIIILSLAAVAIVTVLLLINFVYNKPGQMRPFSEKISGTAENSESLKQSNVKTGNPDLQKAISDYSGGYTANAITGFNSVVESAAPDKDKAIALLYLGIMADNKGDFKGALNYFDRGLKYDKNSSDLYLNTARTYRKIKDFENAVRNAEKSHAISPGKTDSLILLGNISYELMKYDDAIKYYNRALDIDKMNPALLYNTGITLFKKGERFPALEYLKRAAEADKLGDIAFKSYSRLGAEFLSSNMFDLSEKYFKEAASLRPSDPSSRYNLAVSYLRQKKEDLALKELEKAEELSQSDTALLANIGESYFSLKDYDRSLRSFSKILEKNSRDVRILARVGEIYYSQGDLDRAYKSYKKITRIEPATENSRVAYLNMGNILDDTGKFDDAVKSYESALAIKGDDELAYYNMGITYRHSEKPALAVNAWKKASSLNPENIKPRIAVADYYYDQGHLDLAEKEYQNIIYKWPSSQESLFKLGTIYHKQKNYSDAREAYNQVIKADERTDYARKAYINLAIAGSAAASDDKSLNTAVDRIRKALLMKPGDSEALLALGIIYSRKEMHEKAIETFYQVIKSSRESKVIAEAYNNIGKSYYKMQKHKKAIQAFTRGIEEAPSNEEIRINRKTASQAYEEELDKLK